MTDRFVDLPGARIYVVDDGSPLDQPILLLHAGIADSRSWDDFAPLLVDVGYRVLRRDMRGFGRTETEDIEFSNRADVVAVLDALDIGQVVLVGNSAGGQIAIETAIEYPDRIAAVIGLAAGLGGFESQPTPEVVELFEHGDALESAYLKAPSEAAAAALVDFEVDVWVNGPGQPTDRVPASIRDAVRAMDAVHYTPGRAHGRPVPLLPRANDRLAELRCPVLAVGGALDLSDVTQAALHLEAKVPGARAVVLPDVAHLIAMEAPGQLAALMIGFLASLPRWSCRRGTDAGCRRSQDADSQAIRSARVLEQQLVSRNQA
ncbi:MAG: alpha/beta hydrolase [Chloroflexi bacterium]|nr:alpha/beta hydrolase [Chloroflexota bacterium]